MQVELRPLRCFVVLAEELNFRRAAARIHLSQPALSAQIRALEQAIGFALFYRTTRRVDMTAAGVALLPSARHFLEESQRFHKALAHLQQGKAQPMHLGAAYYTIDVPERVSLLEEFFDRHPDVPLDVVTAYQSMLITLLQRGAIDAALLIGLAVSRTTYVAERSRNSVVETIFPDDLPRLVLRRERVKLLWPRAMAHGAFIPLSALAGQKVAMIGRDHGDALTHPILQMLASAGAEPVVPPETHAVAVERYGRKFHLPAISLGWFGRSDDEDFVRLPLEGFALETEFSVVRSPLSTAAGLDIFWKTCRHIGG